MGNNFKDRVVIVTGSGQGIGRAVALAFAAEGAKVVTNNRKPGSTRLVTMDEKKYMELDPAKKKEFDDIYAGIVGDAETTAQTIRDRGGEATAFFGDISKFDVAAELVQTAIDAYGKIDVLVNVAGGFGGGPLESMSEETWDKTNLIKPKGYFNVMRHVLPHMIERQYGRIINCTSKAWMGDIIKHTQYCTANAGVVGLTRGAAIEFYHQGITVNAFAPWAKTRASYEGDYNTDIGGDRAIPGAGAFPTSAVTPEPEAIAPFIMYLASEQAAHVTGTVFTLAGNEICRHSEPEIAATLYKPVSEGYWTLDELFAEANRGLFRGYKNLLGK